MKPRSESERVSAYLKSAGMDAPNKYASGGRVKPNTTIQINIEREKPQGPDPMAMAAMAKPPVVNPQPAPPPMDPNMMGQPGAPGAMPGMNRGGRAGYASGGAVAARGAQRQAQATNMAAKQGRAPVAAGPKVAQRPAAPMPTAGQQAGGLRAALAGRNVPVPGMKRGGRATAIPMEAGAMSGDGRQNKAISQAKASGQKQPVKGTFRTAK